MVSLGMGKLRAACSQHHKGFSMQEGYLSVSLLEY